ncbi:MAG: glutamate--tRNA ligase family protein, partial [Firmicutes bacterium]|nr:glutamate--tRNA ligase family protein [Bacillota bacterium]
AVSFQDLLQAGYLPQAIVNYIALLGWCPKDSNQEIFNLAELCQAFSIDGISKSPSVFDYGKLNWFNSEYIKQLSPTNFAERVMPLLKQRC